MFHVKKAILTTLKRIRLHKERKAGNEEYRRFCQKIWLWGKILNSKRKNKKKKYKPKVNGRGKENNAIFFFWNLTELWNENKIPTCRTSRPRKLFKQWIILSFNQVTKNLEKFERRFKWLNCTSNIYLQSETEPTVIL